MAEFKPEEIVKSDSSDLSFEEINAYSLEKGIKPECEICNNPHWSFISQIEGLRPAIHFSKDFDESAFRMDVIMLCCSNCGNTRILNRWFIDRWKAERSVVSNG